MEKKSNLINRQNSFIKVANDMEEILSDDPQEPQVPILSENVDRRKAFSLTPVIGGTALGGTALGAAVGAIPGAAAGAAGAGALGAGLGALGGALGGGAIGYGGSIAGLAGDTAGPWLADKRQGLVSKYSGIDPTTAETQQEADKKSLLNAAIGSSMAGAVIGGTGKKERFRGGVNERLKGSLKGSLIGGAFGTGTQGVANHFAKRRHAKEQAREQALEEQLLEGQELL